MEAKELVTIFIGIPLALFGLYMAIKEIVENRRYIFKIGSLSEEIKLFLLNPAMKTSVKVVIRLIIVSLLAALLSSLFWR